MVRPRPMTAIVRVVSRSIGRGLAGLNLSGGDAAGQIVIQIEQSRGALLIQGQMQACLGIFQEDMRVILGVVEVQEAKIELAGANSAQSNTARSDPVLRGLGFGLQTMRCGQAQAALLLGQKDSHARHQQCVGQLLDDRFEQGIQIGLRAEPAAKLHQSLAVVVTMAVKSPVDPALNPAFEWFKEGCHQHDGDAFAPVPHRLRQPIAGQTGCCDNHAKVARQGSGRLPACRPRRA